ncbi:alcohol oxidase [Wilcoxina mikolae CBS 423.85]|nr:alcohol oxidase [Wilcoxina mikolae CBS 423.85]
MLKSALVFLALCVTQFTSAIPASASHATVIQRSEDLLSKYDYVIVGGGLSGLVVANRLSEKRSTTVLVIEAGEFDDGSNKFYVPAYVGLTIGTSFDWQVPSLPQEVLVNGNVTVTLGKVVGGGSAINGMLFDRGAPADYDAWQELGNRGWGWDGMLPYFKKALPQSETFTPPTPEQAAQFGITWDPSVHGTKGPVHSSYPPFIYNQTKSFIDGMNQLGVPTSHDQAARALGVFYHPSSVDPATVTRSFARTAYHNTAEKRPNYHLLTSSHVTKLLTKKSLGQRIAYGVQYASKLGGNFSVEARKEVLVAAGAVHTPQLLQLSGIGPKALLNRFKIPVVSDLPGVGSNFQDHPSLVIPYTLRNAFSFGTWARNATLVAEYRALYKEKKEGPFTFGAGNALAFLQTCVVSNRTASLVAAGKAQRSSMYLLPNTPATVAAGYKKQHEILLKLWGSQDAATVEMIQMSTGMIVLALQHELSRGDIRIQSTDPFAHPAVNWRAFTNPLDLELMMDAFLTARRFIATPAIQELQPFFFV